MQAVSFWPHTLAALQALSVLLALMVCGCCLLLASNAGAADFTWGGEGLSTAPFWSNTANWVGGSAPASSSSVGTLTFPSLTASACALSPPTAACYSSYNDLNNLGVNQLQLDDTHGYALSGNAVTLGSGGLVLTAQETTGRPIAHLFLPLELSASQTWNVSGSGVITQTLEVPGTLSGASSNLTIDLSGATLRLGPSGASPVPDDELGSVTVTGPETGDVTLKGPETPTIGGDLELNANLNTTDGHSLSVHNLDFTTNKATGPIDATKSRLLLSGSSVGPLSLTSSLLQLSGQLQVPGASFDSGSAIEFALNNSGTQAGTDYNQLTATGAVELGGVTLDLEASIEPVLQTRECPAPTPGAVYTLVSTTGSLTGSFGNAPDGSTILERECLTLGSHGEVIANNSYPFRVDYHRASSPATVTLTALGNVPANTAPPTISGTATEGQSLGEAHGSWANSPTSYAYQWQRCDTAGNNCQAITDATDQTYAMTAADIGSTIRVAETASNSEGSSSPAVSAPTAVVQAATSSGSQTGGGNTGASNGGGGSSSGSGSTGSGSNPGGSGPAATISSAQIAALLGQQLVPSGRAAKIGALLKSGGYTATFTALEAGTLTVQWYELPSGAKLATKTKAKPVLVASGKLVFLAGGTERLKIRLTAQGRKLLKGAKRVKLVARGEFRPMGGGGVSTNKVFSSEY